MGGDNALNHILVNHYLDIVTPIDGKPLGLLISPDAGRQSYPLMAAGMKQIETQTYDTMVVLADSPDQRVLLQDQGQAAHAARYFEKLTSISADTLKSQTSRT